MKKIKVPKFRKSKANPIWSISNCSVGQIIPREKMRKILILTTWRSGSTFLGDLLNHYPGTFYFFEPLHYYDHMDGKVMPQTEIEFLRSLYHCTFNQDNI